MIELAGTDLSTSVSMHDGYYTRMDDERFYLTDKYLIMHLIISTMLHPFNDGQLWSPYGEYTP